jgi:hypothetical protein
MKIVTSSFRLSLLGVALFGICVVFLEPIAAQYSEIHGLFASIVEPWNPSGLSSAGRIFTGVASFVISIFLLLPLVIITFIGIAVGIPDGELTIDVSGTVVTVVEGSDPRVKYDDNIGEALIPLFILSGIFGYVSHFVTLFFVWTVSSFVTSTVLVLLVDSSIGTVNSTTGSSSSGSNGSSSGSVVPSVDTSFVPSGSGSTVTKILGASGFSSDGNSCPNCGADLTDYDDPEYCPKCGARCRES